MLPGQLHLHQSEKLPTRAIGGKKKKKATRTKAPGLFGQFGQASLEKFQLAILWQRGARKGTLHAWKRRSHLALGHFFLPMRKVRGGWVRIAYTFEGAIRALTMPPQAEGFFFWGTNRSTNECRGPRFKTFLKWSIVLV